VTAATSTVAAHIPDQILFFLMLPPERLQTATMRPSAQSSACRDIFGQFLERISRGQRIDPVSAWKARASFPQAFVFTPAELTKK
jgi:hypothetical protein